MTSEPLTDIMDMVGSFKEKHKQLREVHSGSHAEHPRLLQRNPQAQGDCTIQPLQNAVRVRLRSR